MRGTAFARSLADVLAVLSMVMLVPVPVALFYDAFDLAIAGAALPVNIVAYVLGSAVTGAAGMACGWLGKDADPGAVNDQDTAAGIALAWLVASLFAAMPFLITLGPMHAWFEAMASLTATRSSTLIRAEAAASLMMYRALLQWLAGLAIITVAIAVVSRITHGGSMLLATDITGAGRTRARVLHTARAVAPVYGVLSGVAFLAYLLAMTLSGIRLGWKQGLYEAAIHAMGTVSTGGFSPHAASLQHFQSIAVESIALVMMVLAGTSYAVMLLITQRRRRAWNDGELHRYVAYLAIGAAMITAFLWLVPASRSESLHAGIFSMVSVATTTGFEVTDGAHWPALARAVLIVAMFAGAMVGSASGGIKVLRVGILVRVALRELRRLLHPRAIIPIKQRDRIMDESVIFTIIAFFFAFTTTWLIGAASLLATSPGLSMYEGGMAAASALSNLGQDSGILGTTTGFEHESAAGHFILGILMWVGRLEIFAALLLVSPETWKRFPRK